MSGHDIEAFAGPMSALSDFRLVSVLGRGHFGKVSVPRCSLSVRPLQASGEPPCLATLLGLAFSFPTLADMSVQAG